LGELGREAHSLAGCTGNVGATRLSRLARELEAACKAGDHGAAAGLSMRVVAASTEAVAAVRACLEVRRCNDNAPVTAPVEQAVAAGHP
jgi:HPt (histidine-containing phosphotransfer) domain-containing protein